MEKAWPMMVQYVEYLEKKSDHHILKYGLGDWYDLGHLNPGVSQLTPAGVTSTAIYYYDLKLLAQMAKVLNKEQDIKRFSEWSEKVKTAFNVKFFQPETNVYASGSQTAMAMPLSFGLVDEKIKDNVVKNLVDSILVHNKALTAGDIGFHYLVETLVKNGQSQLLFDMNNRDDVPGYGFQLKHGATALTESWMANRISSNNHLMLGHLMQWFYESLGGIQQEENSVAYKNLIIKPTVVGDISSASAHFQTPYGKVETDWKMKNKVFDLKVTIPANSSALVYLPVTGRSWVTEGGFNQESTDVVFIEKNNNYLIYKVGSGKYDFMVE
jgi:alpha-L-rhamnosidase